MLHPFKSPAGSAISSPLCPPRNSTGSASFCPAILTITKTKALSIKLANVDSGTVYSGDGSQGKDGSANTFPLGGLTVRIPKTTGATVTAVNPSADGWNCGTKTSASKDGEILCSNAGDISFGHTGKGKTESLDLSFNIPSGEDTVFIIVEANYRYCIKTDSVSIDVNRII